MTTTAELYDGAATGWRRAQPLLLSDFTARPFLIEWCAPVNGRRVLDLGCGEGYVARQLADRGARSITGIDVSAEMIAHARERELFVADGIGGIGGIDYRVGDARDLSAFADDTFDLVVAVFLFNYLDRRGTTAAMREVRRVLRPGKPFVFAVPHPSLPFVRRPEKPFYFERDGAGYLSGRDRVLEGRIWRRDGESVPVRCVHKTLSDYFHALHEAGFKSLPEVRELHVTKEHLAFDPEFFEPLRDQALHLAMRIRAPGEGER